VILAPRRPRPLACAAAAALAASCGPADGGTGGMSGRQLVAGRDVADLFFVDAGSLAYSRGAAPGEQTGQPQDLWIWRQADDTSTVALAGIDWAPPVWWPKQRVGDLLETGPQGEIFYDFSTRLSENLNDLRMTPAMAPDPALGSLPPITGIRRDGATIASIVAGTTNVFALGRPGDLHTVAVPGGGSVGAFDFLGDDLALLYAPPSMTDGDPKVGLYRFSPASGQLDELTVRPTPFVDWKDVWGKCGPYGFPPCTFFEVVGCNSFDPPCPGSDKPPCAIVYTNVDPDDTTSNLAYAYDVNSGITLLLPGKGVQFLIPSPDQHRLLWNATDMVGTLFWNLCTGTIDVCPMVEGNLHSWRPGGNGFVAVDADRYMTEAIFDGDTCTGYGQGYQVFSAGYSPSGNHLLWIAPSTTDTSAEVLWLGGADGSAPVEIAEGTFTGMRFTSDEQRLIVARGGISGFSLSWIDLGVTPPAEHTIADNYGGFSRGGDHRILFVDHWNTQDGSGELALVDIESGKRVSLGRAVTEMTVYGGVDAAGATVAYAVRSRVASARDGLWLTTLPAP